MHEFFDMYFPYVGTTESPPIYHRWTAISIVGAVLARKVYFPFGHGNIYPNQYMLLTGTPATKKGTAIKIGKNLLAKINYRHTAPNRAAKEAFWGWMAEKDIIAENDDEPTDFMFDMDLQKEGITEAYIAHDEFLDFIGSGDTDFITNLANLWDNLPCYDHQRTRGKNVYIPNPTVNLISGITPAGIADSFKSLAIGGGFFSRVIFVYAAFSGERVTFPSKPNTELEPKLIAKLQEIESLEGEIIFTPEAKKLIDRIYKTSPGIQDQRFQYYNERRLTHLIKLIIIVTASRCVLEPEEQDIILANTILYNTELYMAKALGEYGKSKYADVANAVIAVLHKANGPMTFPQIFKAVGNDLNKASELIDLLSSLVDRERIQKVSSGKSGSRPMYIPNNKVEVEWDPNLIDFTLLREDEHAQ